MQPIHYFAYGSNMLRARLEERGVVLLDEGQAAQVSDYNLVFNKQSIDGSSKANLMPAPGANAWGGLFLVNSNSLDGLDDAEGAPGHYRRATVTVIRQGEKCEAMTYLAHPNKILKVPARPYDWYLALILAGARACPGIPEEWITHLRQVGQCKPDNETPPRNTFIAAIAQLNAAGYANWQDLLNPALHPCPSVSSVVKTIPNL